MLPLLQSARESGNCLLRSDMVLCILYSGSFIWFFVPDSVALPLFICSDLSSLLPCYFCSAIVSSSFVLDPLFCYNCCPLPLPLTLLWLVLLGKADNVGYWFDCASTGSSSHAVAAGDEGGHRFATGGSRCCAREDGLMLP